jgi:hypothetical protein
MLGKRLPAGAMLAVVLGSCTQPPPVDLAASLKGIDKAKFLRCAGPPTVAFSESGRDLMSFMTNLKRCQAIGAASSAPIPAATCMVDAVFQDNRLVSSSFSGDQSMCSLVFSPCLPK